MRTTQASRQPVHAPVSGQGTAANTIGAHGPSVQWTCHAARAAAALSIG
jgi:hypothetical protein